ncbi:MAG: hypothetical protein [Bacteriophage sp.]|nr:MAG: hypothetical protein [Bacteriophage sp.]
MGCNERKIACHDKCQKYKEFKNKLNSFKEIKKQNAFANEVKFNSIFRSCDLRDKRSL